MNIKKLSSIPGRIRLYIEGLKGNSSAVINIKNLLKSIPSIDSIHINIKTGNILLTYDSYCIDEDLICNVISSSHIKINNLNNITYTENKLNIFSKELFSGTKSLSHRLLAISISAASFLLFTAEPIYTLCSLIFGIPAILYINSYVSLKYILENAALNDIHIKEANSIERIRNINYILIHPQIVFNDCYLKNPKLMDHPEIEGFIYTKKVTDPINIEARNLIKKLRYIGINNIAILEDNVTKRLILYANKTLGLYNIKEDAKHNNLIITQENVFSNINDIDRSLILGILHGLKSSNKDINITCHELSKIPWIIQDCRISQEYLVRSQAAAISINILGIFFALIKHINLSGTILLYFLNTFGNLFYIRHKTLMHTKKQY
ncbi:HMA2 domain-containing protein [Clostridium sp. BL-8]|uniref:HMA2 domain-containing protein n=1 Tax=Clostridium sp. BL-8 TaxID=349938 RepID=UPI00098C4C47|nr:hypothetical protein [Clostridium sp. BL-8]OOM78938.1 hypothetical protein CLOBL_19280 [Clostridium sp. BL-8]